MTTLERTDSTHPALQILLPELDAELAITDGDEHDFYRQYNGIEDIKYFILAYEGTVVIGCGALKAYDENTMEVKRMYVRKAARGRGVAGEILAALEQWAIALDYQSTILETGVRQLPAIRLYEKSGYRRIPNYGQYAQATNSVCMQKQLFID